MTTPAVNAPDADADADAGDDGAPSLPGPVFTPAELGVIARALQARADIYTRLAGMATTVPDYEIAARAARRHRALAQRALAERARAARTPPHPPILRGRSTGPDGQHG